MVDRDVTGDPSGTVPLVGIARGDSTSRVTFQCPRLRLCHREVGTSTSLAVTSRRCCALTAVSAFAESITAPVWGSTANADPASRSVKTPAGVAATKRTGFAGSINSSREIFPSAIAASRTVKDTVHFGPERGTQVYPTRAHIALGSHPALAIARTTARRTRTHHPRAPPVLLPGPGARLASVPMDRADRGRKFSLSVVPWFSSLETPRSAI